MTAEIAILNKSAVALAADSKVTVSIKGNQKTFDTVNKLFSMSKTEPVGAMVFGNAEYMGFPWETIIKEYRRRSPRKKFDTVRKWGDDFCEFLTQFYEFTIADELEFVRSVAITEINDLIREVDRRVNEIPNKLDNVKLEEFFVNNLEQFISELNGLDDSFSEKGWLKFKTEAGDFFQKLVEEKFNGLEVEIKEKIAKFVELSIKKTNPFKSSSGLVIAGFGESELFPSLIAFNIDGVISGELKTHIINDVDISRSCTAGIIPFAQGDMVCRFMNGIDPQFEQFYEETFAGLLIENTQAILDVLNLNDEELTKHQSNLEEAVKSSLDTLEKVRDRFQKEVFSESVIDMASRLPRDELAHMAESLVNLTSLQRKVSPNIETVGGAVDVAVISKGDGFVWIKRKHYFPADKNLQFVKSYLSEYRNVEGEQDE